MNDQKTLYNWISSADDNASLRLVELVLLSMHQAVPPVTLIRVVPSSHLIWNQRLMQHKPAFGFKSTFVLEESLTWGKTGGGKRTEVMSDEITAEEAHDAVVAFFSVERIVLC